MVSRKLRVLESICRKHSEKTMSYFDFEIYHEIRYLRRECCDYKSFSIIEKRSDPENHNRIANEIMKSTYVVPYEEFKTSYTKLIDKLLGLCEKNKYYMRIVKVLIYCRDNSVMMGEPYRE